MPTFRSDNNAGICAEALEALSEAATGAAVGYGDDEWTARAQRALRDLFGCDAPVFFVATGTAANTLAIMSMTRPWQRVLCYETSHWNDDESTAPERFTQCRTTTIEPALERSSKLTPDDLRAAGVASRGDVHQPQPGALTISNPTEFGEVYTGDQTAALAQAARELGYRVHVDGARFANAVASRVRAEGVDAKAAARSLTVDAGVDALSFGGTKNGLAFGEAVVFFPQGDGAVARRAAAELPYHRKSTGHLLSKHRYVSAQFARTLDGGAWLRHAAHANAMATTLGEGLERLGYEVPFPVDANAVFVRLSEAQDKGLRDAGHEYYPFGPARWRIARLMCGFDTEPADVDRLLADAARLAEPS